MIGPLPPSAGPGRGRNAPRAGQSTLWRYRALCAQTDPEAFFPEAATFSAVCRHVTQVRNRLSSLEAAARGLSQYGYANLSLERVVSEAGFTRGALYHQFADKEERALAVVRWVERTWHAEGGHLHTTDAEIQLSGRAPYDTELAERAVRGLLGLPPQAVPTNGEVHE